MKKKKIDEKKLTIAGLYYLAVEHYRESEKYVNELNKVIDLKDKAGDDLISIWDYACDASPFQEFYEGYQEEKKKVKK